MNTRDNKGPKTEPCGYLTEISADGETMVSTISTCFLLKITEKNYKRLI